MRKKIIQIIMVLVVLLQTFSPNFTQVEAKKTDTRQPITCNWPSEMMSHYFDFQKESIKILLWSKINSMRFSASFDKWWLFTNKVLNLKWTTAIDLIASSVVWNTKSFVSNVITSTVLLSIASASVIQSNTEWLAILFKDRPIVRDYKTMMDIETELFDIAYFRSKEIDLTQPFESDLLSKLNDLIKKYQWLWLLEEWSNIKGWESMANIIMDLVSMNAAMRHFIMLWWNLWEAGLHNYAWCFWNLDSKMCNRSTAIIKLKDKAIEQLQKDYKDVRTFGKCNSNATFFKSTINKTINNNKEATRTAINDINEAMKRLKWALIWSYDGKVRKNRCDMSDYEMAQLQAYRWWDRTCNESFFNIDISTALLETKNYFNAKKAQREQKEKSETLLKEFDKPETKDVIIWDIAKKLKEQSKTSSREQIRHKIYWEDTIYNPDFSFEMNSEFIEIFRENMDQFSQAQENAIATDISDLFPGRGKGILNQIWDSTTKANILEQHLQTIEDTQCK